MTIARDSTIACDSVPDSKFALNAVEIERLRRAQRVCWIVALVLGIVQTLANVHAMNPDGVCYLDMGDAFFRGDWQMAINGLWSPLYGWLLGLAMYVIKPQPYWEFAVAHLVNFLIYIGALASFDFFLREVIKFSRQRDEQQTDNQSATAPIWMLLVFGYVLFIWSSLRWIGLGTVAPDLCVAVTVYFASACLVRIRRGLTGWNTFAVLGAILGVGYLAKGVMLPLGFVFIITGAFLVGDIRRAIPRVVLAFLIFFIIASPFVVALSMKKGHLSFGDAGQINYALYVNEVRRNHWQGIETGSGTPVHPTRKISDDPAIYEFATPVGGTYPAWYGQAYWYEGITPRFNIAQQLRACLINAKDYFDLVRDIAGVFLACLFIIFYVGAKGRFNFAALASYWFLAFPASAGLGVYLLLHTHPRYIAPFAVMFALAVALGIRLPRTPENRRLFTSVFIIILFTAAVSTASLTVREIYAVTRNFTSERTSHKQWEIAEQVKRLGIKQGNKIAFIGSPFEAYWARIAKVTIIAEVPSGYGNIATEDASKFWASDAQSQMRVIETLKETGADAIFADEIPVWATAESWHKLNDGVFIYRP